MSGAKLIGRWPMIAALAVVLLASFHCIIEEDLWWHLRAGEEIAAGRGIPRVDAWSYPSAGRPYVDLHWLFQAVVHRVDAFGGISAVILFKCAVLLAAFVLIYRVARRRSGVAIASMTLAWAAVLASERFLARPEIFTFLFLALFLWLLARYEEGRTRALWILPAVQLLWVNSEGLFVLGWVVLGCHAAALRRDRRFWTSAAACVAVSLANPFFLEGALHPFLLFTRVSRGMAVYSETIGELLSPFRAGIPHPSVILLPYHLALLALAGLLRWKRPSVKEVFLLVAFGYLALSARRNIGLFAIASTPILAAWAQDAVGLRARALSAPRARLARRVAFGLVAAAGLLYAIAVMNGRLYAAIGTNRAFRSGVGECLFPEGAIRFLRQQGPAGPLFHTLGFGGYLIERYPEQKVFIDGRLEVHETSHYARALRALASEDEWKSLDERFRFGVVLVNYGEAIEFTMRRVQDPEWIPVHLDATALVFVRNRPEHQGIIDREGLTAARLRELFPSVAEGEIEGLPAPRGAGGLLSLVTPIDYPWSEIYLGQFLGALRFHDLAAAQYARAVRRAPGLPDARLFLAQSLQRIGRTEDARRAHDAYRAMGGSEPLAP